MKNIYFHRLYSSGEDTGKRIFIGVFTFLLLLILMLIIIVILGFEMSAQLLTFGFGITIFGTAHIMGKISPHKDILEVSLNEKRFKLVLRDISDECMFIKENLIDTENQGFTLTSDSLGKKHLVKGDIKVPYSHIWMRNLGKFQFGDDKKLRDWNKSKGNYAIQNDFDFISDDNKHYEIGLHMGQIRVFLVKYTDEVSQNLHSYTPESAKTLLSWEESYKLISPNV